MIEEIVYQEYSLWKDEMSDFINQLTKLNSTLLIRVTPVINVLDYLLDDLIDNPDYDEENNHIFKTGFAYLREVFDTLLDVCKNYYDNDIHKLNQESTKVNLLMNAIDFKSELINYDESSFEAIKSLDSLITKIYDMMQSNSEFGSDVYNELDLLIETICSKTGMTYEPIDSIFLDLEDIYNI